RRLDLSAARDQYAARQLVLLEDALDGLQIERRRQIHYREIFVVERAVRGDARRIVLGDVAELPREGAEMARQVHRHERTDLHEPRVDAAMCAGVARRDPADQVRLEPV